MKMGTYKMLPGLLFLAILAVQLLSVQADYDLISIKPTNYGWEGLLTLSSKSEYPGDIQYLSLSVWFETDSRLRITLRDANYPRWEIPSSLLLAPNTPPSQIPPSMKYNFTYTPSPFGFAVTRISNNYVLINTSLSDWTNSNARSNLTYTNTYLEFTSKLPLDHVVYGLGERIAPLRLPLRTYTIETTDWGNPQWDNLYGHHPVYMRMEDDGQAHMVMLWNSHPMDVVLAETSIQYRVIGGIIDLFVFLGPEPLEVISQYTDLIGKPFMPPLWSVGFHQCRWGYPTANYTLEVAKNYTLFQLPLDAIWNDIDWMENYLAYTFAGEHDGNRYTPVDVLALNQYLDKGRKHHVYIVDPNIPAVLQDYENKYYPYESLLQSGAYVVSPAGDAPLFNKQWPPVPVAWPDWTNPNILSWLVDNIKRWGNFTGVASGLWLDMNEPSTFCAGQLTPSCNGYASEDFMTRRGVKVAAPKYIPNQGRIIDPRAVPQNLTNRPTDMPYPPYLPGGQQLESKSFNISSYHYIGRHYSVKSMWGSYEQKQVAAALASVRGKRPFTLSRSQFMGSGRWGAHWLGDNNSQYGDMSRSIASILAMGIYGISMTGADICGFGQSTTAELCTRWMQLGSLYPFSRNHNAIGQADQEPYRFGEPYTTMNRISLELRYTLLPYLYSLFATSHIKGHPVWRALSWEFSKDPNTWSIDLQAMVGSALLIIPVLDEGETFVTGYMPNADWFNFYTNQRILAFNETQGYLGVNLTYCSSIDDTAMIPLVIRGGHIVPTQLPKLSTFETWTTPYTFQVALDSTTNSAFGEVYIDDGETLDALENGYYNHLNFTANFQVMNKGQTPYVVGSFVSNIVQLYKGYPLDPFAAVSFNIMGLNLPSNYDPSSQQVCIALGPGKCGGSIAVVQNGDSLQVTVSAPFSQSFSLNFLAPTAEVSAEVSIN